MNSPTADDLAAPTLLGTKLHAPRLRRGLIFRPRLSRTLDPASLTPITVVAAPAGFGKTTLLAESFAPGPDGDKNLAWVSLDARDNDPARFWSYLIAAVQSTAPGSGQHALGLLRDSQPTDAIVASLLNDLATIDDETVLVLDDYHAIDSSAIHESIAFAIEYLPDRLHLVIGTRVDPPLPLARWRASGDLRELRASDLRFSVDEATAYLNETMGLDLQPSEVVTLDDRTEGWIAALQLAALSLEGRVDRAGFISTFAGDDRFVVDYLADEVLGRQPPDVRKFLLHTSVLDRFTASLCDAVTGRDDSRAMIEDLDRANLFVVQLDDRRLWYRYHHLFADVLRARLMDDEPALVTQLHDRACGWYVSTGDTVAAITHAIAAEDHDRAAQLIEIAAPSARKHRQERALRGWLEELPSDVYPDRPVLAITLVGARMATGDTDGVHALLDAVESTLRRSEPARYVDDEQFAGLPAQVEVYRAALALLSGALDDTVAHASAALELMEPSDHVRRGSAAALIALAHWTGGDLETAEARYVEAIDALTAAGFLSDVLGCSLALADIRIAQGRLSDAASVFEDGLRLTGGNPGLRGAADMHVGLSEVLIERDDLEAAERHLDASTALGETSGLPQHAYRWRVAQARLSRARGDLDTALELIEEAAPLVDLDFSPRVRPVSAIAARVQLAAGDVAKAVDWAQRHHLRPDDVLSYLREYEHTTLARVLLARFVVDEDPRHLADALTLLDRLVLAADEADRLGARIEIRVLLAAAHHAERDMQTASRWLNDALQLAEPEGHLRVFLHAGPGVTEMVRSAARSSTGHPYAVAVLAAMDRPRAPRPPRTPQAGLVDELSPRELEVLDLLRSDLSGPEIASELIVSLNTMRTHTKNIYMKLGVNNRREAIRRADELGLRQP